MIVEVVYESPAGVGNIQVCGRINGVIINIDIDENTNRQICYRGNDIDRSSNE